MAGMKLRMPPGEFWQFLGESIGANPTPVAFAEVYTALQTGAIDGQDNPLVLSRTMKFYEVTTQFVLTSHVIGYDMMADHRQGVGCAEARAAGQVRGRRREGDRRLDRQVQRAGKGGHRLLQGAGPAGLHARRRRLPRLRAEEVPRLGVRPRTGRRACSSASTRSSNAAQACRSHAGLAAPPRRESSRRSLHAASMFPGLPRARSSCAYAIFDMLNDPAGPTSSASSAGCGLVLWGAAFVVRERDEIRFDIIYGLVSRGRAASSPSSPASR